MKVEILDHEGHEGSRRKTSQMILIAVSEWVQ
jgi:hypothetical protein